MKPKIGIFIALVVWGLSLTVLNSTVLSASGDKNKGEQVYQQYCQVCHGPQGKGDGPVGMSLKPPPANLASKKVKNKPDSELLNTIRKGKPGTAMPGWENDLSEQQINDVIAHVRTLSN
jgi:mono/diheme cytochrome c family protein